MNLKRWEKWIFLKSVNSLGPPQLLEQKYGMVSLVCLGRWENREIGVCFLSSVTIPPASEIQLEV